MWSEALMGGISKKELSNTWKFIKSIAYEVGKGDMIAFWEDVWCGDRLLKFMFPDIYQLAENRLARVVDCMEPSFDKVFWCPTLRRDVFDWELPFSFSLLERLSNVAISVDHLDQKVCQPSFVKSFFVKPCYTFIESSRDVGFPWKKIWNHMVSLKVQFFLWTASLRKLSTLDVLSHNS